MRMRHRLLRQCEACGELDDGWCVCAAPVYGLYDWPGLHAVDTQRAPHAERVPIDASLARAPAPPPPIMDHVARAEREEAMAADAAASLPPEQLPAFFAWRRAEVAALTQARRAVKQA